MKSTPFLKPGLIYFWCLNDDCNLAVLRRQLRAFAEGGIGTVVLHPRSGLMVPYLGRDWFELIRTIVDECVALGIQPWLYDENFCPSGSAGGRIAIERPDLMARGIERFVAPAELPPGELFLFPSGTLLWAGAVPPAGGAGTPREQTDRVGLIRRHWEVSPWDSRWYYPGLPLYDCPRATDNYPEYALRAPELPSGWRLVAFVARPVGRDEMFGSVIDSLNPAGTRAFLDRTHERYAQVLGDRLGRDVPAIFTDEPKFFGGTPWTPGLFEDFQARYGYDLRPRLNHLFDPPAGPETLATRVHYRQWCGRRFIDSWLEPVRDWCRRHQVAFVGHISPEDDLITQPLCVGNMMDIFESFDLPGLDVIVPAVGDERHAMLNIGGLSGVSAAQQLDRPTALSETLGVSGLSCDPRLAGKILAWQALSGVGAITIHAAMVSSLGLRLHEAPPDFGPDSPRWPGMTDVSRGLTPFFEIVRDSTQIAPVAVLWPIRSFMAETTGWQFEDAGRRKAFHDVVMACLTNQVGIQFLDEGYLRRARLEGKKLRLGRAAFERIVIPPSLVVAKETIAKLAEWRRAGLPVHVFGELPAWADNGKTMTPVANGPWEPVTESDWPAWCRQHLPKVLPIETDRPGDLRSSRWIKDGREFALVMNIRAEPCRCRLGGLALDLNGGELVAAVRNGETWTVQHRFDPATVRGELPAGPMVPCREWAVRWPGGSWEPLDRPKAVYQIRPVWNRPEDMVRMCLTGSAPIGGDPVAESVEYRATVACDGPVRPGTLVLEPTAIRGRGVLNAGTREWAFSIADTDTRPVEIGLAEAVPASGTLTLVFRFDKPMPFDGLKLSPVIRGQ